MVLFFRRRGIAVVEAHGVIGTRIRESVYARIFESVARNPQYRALLLDVDSPGGSAAGSDVLYRSLRRVAEQKPVVAYVRGIGASGGYYMCCAATKVMALPTALVGSIGVIYLRPVLEQLLGKAGVEFSVFKGGRLKDMSGFWRSPTDEESERFQELITEIYDNFVSVVAKGRSLDAGHAGELATGEVFTGRRAQEVGLVDDLGDFQDALSVAATLGDVKPRPRWMRPRRPLSERLFGRLGGGQPAVGMLTAEMQRLLAGGIYYLEPSYLLGGYPDYGDGR